jgi:hypothetical protein
VVVLRFVLFAMAVLEREVRGSEVRGRGKERRGERSDVGEVKGEEGEGGAGNDIEDSEEWLPSRCAVESS